jgi:hypothetical protein
LLVVHHQIAVLRLAILSRTLVHSPFDDGQRYSIGRGVPLAQPLVLQRCRHDQQAATHATRLVEHVTGGDRLGGLAESHVVGEEQALLLEETLDPLLLVGVELALQSLQV